MMNFNIEKDNRQKSISYLFYFKPYRLKDLRYKTLPKKVADH